MASRVSVMCFQEINQHWARMISAEVQWKYVWEDSKAIAWSKEDSGVDLVWSEWLRVYPDDQGARRRDRGVLWAAHCLMG